MQDSEKTHEQLSAVAEWAGVLLEDAMVGCLEEYAQWLTEEAVMAGGIGPNEVQSVWADHVLDSLLFAGPLVEHAASNYETPGSSPSALDLGAGVGLPGIPLAIALPDFEFTLLDRSGRRCELAQRAVRILELGNVRVVQRDLAEFRGSQQFVVARASVPPKQMLPKVQRALPECHTAVAGGSRIKLPEAIEGWQIREVPGALLGEPRWLYVASLSPPPAS